VICALGVDSGRITGKSEVTELLPACRPTGQKLLTRLTERVEGREAPAFRSPD
jgi:hypothetical protein